MNYFLLGMVNIMLSSNMAALSEQWETDKAGISYIISAIGNGCGSCVHCDAACHWVVVRKWKYSHYLYI
ncbi:hypothetical protein BTO30_03475 [Domibacillus antri]|uniref:Uncharacterized protein n=1 Tax=Domibacillus antri TaxID=1714264 RepID=A0A1Q8Q8L3_9BACI|nr:hypothetical protein BTO30_03475 [Domibacillus antri]